MGPIFELPRTSPPVPSPRGTKAMVENLAPGTLWVGLEGAARSWQCEGVVLLIREKSPCRR
jgi:hypothetical protein